MKHKQASIVLAFFVLSAFLSCTEQESASPQEIANAVELRAADIAEETPLPAMQQASIEGANAPAIYQVSAEEQAFTVFLEPVHYFEPLAADETLATLRTDSTTTQILAISQERNTYRFIYELSGAPTWLSWFRSYNDSRSTFLRRGLRNDNSPAPFYHIDGENGVISHLFDVSTSFQISFDGRFVAFVPDYQANRNRISLFSMEEGDVIAQFVVTLDRWISLQIFQDGISNFKIFNSTSGWNTSNAEGVLDTENLTLQMEEKYSLFRMHGDDEQPAVLVQLNDLPRLRHSLNIELPLPAPGRLISASELVNVYSEPDFSSEVIQRVERLTPPLGTGTNFELYEIGEEAMFDGITSHWAYVELISAWEDGSWWTGIFGWVFLGLMIY